MSGPRWNVEQVESVFQVRLDGFADLSTEGCDYEESPKMRCLGGREFTVSVYPGGTESSYAGMVAVDVDTEYMENFVSP